MERDSSVKRLDFEDASLISSPLGNKGTLELSGLASGTLTDVPVPEPSTDQEFQRETQRIRENATAVVEYVNKISHQYQQKVKAVAGATEHSVEQWKNVHDVLASQSWELCEKEAVYDWLLDWKIGDETKVDSNQSINETDADNVDDEFKMAVRDATAEINSNTELLIRTMAHDVDGLEKDLGAEHEHLATIDTEAGKLKAEDQAIPNNDDNVNGRPILAAKQPKNLKDLEATIKELEEKLEQNELEYLEAEAAMESRIEQYNREIEELQAQAVQLDREEECMRMLIYITSRFLQSQKYAECINDVSVVSMEDGCVDLLLTTNIPNVDNHKDLPDQASNLVLEHNLHIKIDQETMEIEEAKLTPDDVPMNELLAAAKESVTSVSREPGNEGNLAQFGSQLASLVREVHDWLAKPPATKVA